MRAREKQLELENDRLYRENYNLREKNNNLEKDLAKRINHDMEERLYERIDEVEKDLNIKMDKMVKAPVVIPVSDNVKVCPCGKNRGC